MDARPSDTVNIAGFPVGPAHPPLILAEIGINHNGDVSLGEAMIRSAKAAGAHAVKFQAFTPSRLFNPLATPKAVELFAEWALDRAAFTHLHAVATAEGIPFLCTPFGVDWVEFLDGELDVPAFKIASSDCTNLLLLEAIGATGKPAILSTGMSTLDEVHLGVETLLSSGCPGLVLLHCVTQYPPVASEVNLAAIDTLSETFPWPIGYSDHWLGNLASYGALSRGACLIEKHFTIDRMLPGPDQEGSADPEGLRELVDAALQLWQMRGDGVKEAKGREEALRTAGRPGLYIARDLPAGHVITRKDLYAARPQGSLPASELHRVLGMTLAEACMADAPFAMAVAAPTA